MARLYMKFCLFCFSSYEKEYFAFIQEIFGRLLSMLFLWFHSTVRLPGNEVGSILGKLKSEVRRKNNELIFIFIYLFHISMLYHGLNQLSKNIMN